jgi:WD40 repeat protein
LDAPILFNAVGFIPDGRYVWTTDGPAVQLWEAGSGGEKRRYEYQAPLISAAVSPDKRCVLGGGLDGTLVVWDADTGDMLHTLRGHEAEITSIAVSPDNQFALTAGASDSTARLWDLNKGQSVHVFDLEADVVFDTAFSPDGRFALATAPHHSAIMMWDTSTGELVREFKLARPEGTPSVAVSPDGETVTVGGRLGNIYLFDLTTGEQTGVMAGHTDMVHDLAYSPDGRRLISASRDGTARLWDVAAGAELRRYNNQPHSLQSAAFAPDGQAVLVGGSDGVARMYGVDLQDTVRYLCRRLGRDFTADEREQYGITGESPTCQP